jgi:hypothetical protein
MLNVAVVEQWTERGRCTKKNLLKIFEGRLSAALTLISFSLSESSQSSADLLEPQAASHLHKQKCCR